MQVCGSATLPSRNRSCAGATLLSFSVGTLRSPCSVGIPSEKGGDTTAVDFVTDLDLERIDAFVAAVETDFHVVAEAVHRAVRERSSFNLIHEETLVKADVYVLPDDPTHCEQLVRSCRVALRSEPGSAVELASPEDVVIQKLRWYEMGGRVSDRQ